jgi:cell division inhibitor SepF
MQTPFRDRNPEVVVIHPVAFTDVQLALQMLRERKTVLLDLEGMGEGEAQRAVDFVSGGVVAMDGQTERLGERTFLFTPVSVHVEHDLGDD